MAQAITQTCVINLLRNSFRYASKRDWAAIAKDLKLVYTAASESAVLDAFVAFSETWGERYPAIIKLWENAWAEFVPFLAFDKEIRSDLYDQQHRKPELEDPQGGERPRPLPIEQAALKCVYLAIMSIDPTGKGRKRWVSRWKAPLNAFELAFPGRLITSRN
ncbi:MAG: putative transposase [Mycobacterium sp.]|nr:putative transposase [Mycobacterium sp.]